MDRKGRSGNLDGERVGGERFEGALAMVKMILMEVGFGNFFLFKTGVNFRECYDRRPVKDFLRERVGEEREKGEPPNQ